MKRLPNGLRYQVVTMPRVSDYLDAHAQKVARQRQQAYAAVQVLTGLPLDAHDIAVEVQMDR